MFSLRAYLLGLVVLAGTTVASFAADLGGMHEDESPAYAASSARFYLRGDVGYDWQVAPSLSESDTSFSSTSMGSAWTFGGGVGMYLSPNWRADVTYDHINDSKVKYSWASSWNSGTGEFEADSNVVLANLYYDFSGRAGFNPYVGAGIGWAENHAHSGMVTDACGCMSTIQSGNENNFAWALMAGFTRQLDRGFSLDAGYRFLSTGKAHTGDVLNPTTGTYYTNSDPSTSNLYSNELRIGIRYDIQ